MPKALWDRLATVYDGRIATNIQAAHADDLSHGTNPWHFGFGAPIADVRVIMPHETSTPPHRTLTNRWARSYRNGATGPQYYISSDGTAFGLINDPPEQAFATWHGRQVNTFTLGVETGHPWANHVGDDHLGPDVASNGWRRLSRTAATDPDDIPGLDAWLAPIGGEIVVSWWTTANYRGPWARRLGAPEMVFTEAEYRTWALLARYLCEQFQVPRNFPYLPHSSRDASLSDAARFKKLVLADEILSRSISRDRLGLSQVDFDHLADDDNVYAHAVHAVTSPGPPTCPAVKTFPRNPLWDTLTFLYRGFYGHALSGDTVCGGEHDCPGPLFDWHRLAREVWDWWWHPFDVNDAGTSTAVALRPYARPDGATTPVVEYYYARDEAAYRARVAASIHGPTGSPETFDLDAGSPVYALANGELVAARFPPETDRVSAAFLLVRHEVFHRLDPLQYVPLLRPDGSEVVPHPPAPGRLDYDAEPSYAYSLYMHLGRGAWSFAEVSAANPGWLNRILMRKKECDLGIAFHAAHAAEIEANAALKAAWASIPPGNPPRPNVLAGWMTDQLLLGTFLQQLASGAIALAPHRSAIGATSIRIQLGDHLAIAGVRRRDTTGSKLGLRVEVFSPMFLSSDWKAFTSSQATGWNAPSPVPGPGPAVWYPSEWARVPSGAERTALEAAGVDVGLVPWWPAVASWTRLDARLASEARLDPAGWVWHYRPHDFMRWINQATWRSEWPKYRLQDTSVTPHVPLPLPARPQPRLHED